MVDEKVVKRLVKKAAEAELKHHLAEVIDEEVGKMLSGEVKTMMPAIRAEIAKALNKALPELVEKYITDLKKNAYINIEW